MFGVQPARRPNRSHVVVREPLSSCDVGDDELLLLADAQTSGGLLVAGELPGAMVVGEFVPLGTSTLEVR